MSDKRQASWNPTQYEKFKNERTQPFLDLMDFVQPFEHGKIIDLGCGTGELTKLLHHRFKPITTLGIDSSLEMLNKSEEFIEPGLSFAQANIESWSPTEKYDLIFSNAALQWCDNHEALFTKIYNGLKDGGQLAVQMPMNHDYPTHVLAKEMSEEPHWKALLKGEAFDKYASLLSVEDYARLFFKLGFREQKATFKIYGHVLESREDVVEWVKGSMLSHFRSRLSEKDFESFVSEFKQRLFQVLPDERPFFYPFKRTLLWARR